MNKLRKISKLDKILGQWRRDHLWRIYDQFYDPLSQQAPLHQNWLIKNNLPQSQSSIFSIGPGRGELELALCQDHDCVLGYAETYSRYCQEVEESFATAGLENNIIERHQAPYQNFIPTRYYDLILSIHSWYSFGLNAKLLKKALDMLTPGGIMIVTVTSKEDFFFHHNLVRQSFSAEELSQWATDRGFFNQFHLLPTLVATEKLRVNNSLTREAKGIISFLKGKLWWRIPREERHRVSQIIQQLNTSDPIERVHGLLCFDRSCLS